MKKVGTVILILLAGCGVRRERDEPLVNGYRFVELSRGNAALTKSGDFVVYPNVVEHQVYGNIIVGRRRLANDNTDDSEAFTTGLGYFILDTSTGHLSQGLAKPSTLNGK